MNHAFRKFLIVGLALIGGAALGFAAFQFGSRHLPAESSRSSASAGMSAALKSALSGGGTAEARMRAMYRQRGFHPLWLDADGAASADARAVIAVLSDAPGEGLPSGRYVVPGLPRRGASERDRARFDVALSQASLAYARDMEWGVLDPTRLFDDVSLPRHQRQAVAALTQAASEGRAGVYLKSLEPQGEYQRLKAALKKLQAPAPDWPLVPPSAARGGHSAVLAARLQAEGYGAAGQGSAAEALKDFQATHGLPPSGKPDAGTVAALNVTRKDRAAQIAANMERWRWLPRQMGEDFMMVNVPTANLALMEDGAAAIRSRVVVGAPDKPTPILATQAVAVTINPSWHIPKSIVENEIKPKLARDPGYLEAKDMQEQNGEFIQNPGPGNALGVAKFEMPNDFDVYLHDTPSKRAFLSDDRTLSHGCVRVEAIRPLVAHLLAISDEELSQRIDANVTSRQPLKHPIPVYILYWTAFSGDDGRIHFADDVYGRDAKVIAALQSAGGTRLASER